MARNNQEETISTKEAAEMLGVATSTVNRMINRGDLKAYKKTPVKYSPFRVYKSSVEKVKEERQR
ncbi:MAG: helix-turn-helix domain-containing protein [bacterium]